MKITRVALAAPLAVLAFTLTGCSATSVTQSDLEKEVGRDEDGVSSVSCDGDLEGEVDATQDCTVTYDDDSTVDIVAKVTKVDGSNVEFDIELPDGE